MSLALAWSLRPSPVVISASGIDGGTLFRTRGPFVLQQQGSPSLAFATLEHSQFGLRPQVTFLVVLKHNSSDSVMAVPEAFNHQGGTLVSRVGVTLNGQFLSVDHLINGWPWDGSPSWYSDGSLAPKFEESLEVIVPELPGDQPVEFDLSKGRVFVIQIGASKTNINQIDTELFTTADLRSLDDVEIANYVYKWLKDSNLDTKK